jgi:hypothetical protein
MSTDKTRNIIEMAFMFSTMGRVFEKKSQSKILPQFEKLMEEVTADNVLSLHEEFIKWFQGTIITAHGGKPASYGQAAKVVDIMLKVCVSYCHLPSPEEAARIVPKLAGAVDNLVLEHLEYEPGLGALDEKLYSEAQVKLRKEAAVRPLCEYDDILFRALRDEKRKLRSKVEHYE